MEEEEANGELLEKSPARLFGIAAATVLAAADRREANAEAEEEAHGKSM